MERLNVHIAIVGTGTYEPCIIGCRHFSVDRLYILHSKESKEMAETARKKLSESGLDEVTLEQVDPFDINSTVNAITAVYESEKDNELMINITGGTNVMSAAALTTAFFTGTKAYYILDKNKLPKRTPLRKMVIELPVPNVPYIKDVDPKKIEILKKLEGQANEIKGTHSLSENNKYSPQILSHHLKGLARMNLIELRKEGRNCFSKITNAGKLVLRWSRSK